MPVPRPDISIRNTLRNNGIPIGRFQGLLDLPKREQKRELLGLVQEVYDGAMARQGLNRSGSFDNPDYHSAGKMIEVARAILELGEDGSGGGDGDVEESTAEKLAKAAHVLERERKMQAA